MSGEDALVVLRRRVVEWANDAAGVDAVVDAACQALLDDVGGDAVTTLACLPPSRDRDADPAVVAVIEAAADDLGWRVVPRLSPHAWRAWLHQQAQDVLDGRLSAEEFALWICTTTRHDDPAPLAELDRLSHEYSHLYVLVEDGDCTREDITSNLHALDAHVLTCAHRILTELASGTR